MTVIVAMAVAMDVIYVYGVIVLNNSNLTMKNTCILQQFTVIPYYHSLGAMWVVGGWRPSWMTSFPVRHLGFI